MLLIHTLRNFGKDLQYFSTGKRREGDCMLIAKKGAGLLSTLLHSETLVGKGEEGQFVLLFSKKGGGEGRKKKEKRLFSHNAREQNQPQIRWKRVSFNILVEEKEGKKNKEDITQI